MHVSKETVNRDQTFVYDYIDLLVFVDDDIGMWSEMAGHWSIEPWLCFHLVCRGSVHMRNSKIIKSEKNNNKGVRIKQKTQKFGWFTFLFVSLATS